jgi:hypothetical protein
MDRNSISPLLFRRRKRTRNRLHWVHPVIKKMEEFGAFYTLFDELRADAKKFFKSFLESVPSFDEMHCRLKERLQRRNSKMRNYIQPAEILAVAIK